MLTYDANRRIATLAMEDVGLAGTVEYNNAGRPSKLNIPELNIPDGNQIGAIYIQYSYNAQGQLTSMEGFSSLFPLFPLYVTEFEYSAAGQISKATASVSAFLPENDIVSPGYTTYLYDSRGNISKESRYEGPDGDTELAYTIEYTHDTAINPTLNLEKLIYGVGSPNNILTAVNKAADGTVDREASFTATYQYDGSFPTTSTITYQNGEVNTVSITYNCD